MVMAQNLNEIAVLIDELKSVDQKKRIRSVESLGTVAIALGMERTRTELLKYILELMDDEEEVLLKLAEIFPQFIELSGGPQYAEFVLRPLERLCASEEATVREMAIKSAKEILGKLQIKDFEQPLMDMLMRLINGDNFTSKFAAVQLMPIVYPHFSQQNQQKIMNLYNELSHDDTPQVRKQCAITLKEMIKLIPRVSETELLNIFSYFYRDEQDTVRMQQIDSCVCFAQNLPPEKVNSFLLPYIRKFAEDKSWRIRYLVADRIMDLAKGIGNEKAQTVLLPFYTAFLKDVESEVRTAACGRLAEFCKLIDSQEVINKIIPNLKELEKDSFAYVRSALAENLLSICPIIDRSATNEQILPMFLNLLRDENSEVRLNLFKRLEDLNSVIGIEDLQQSIIPSLTELAQDKNWRIKLSVVQQIPILARQLGEQFFNEKLQPICSTWLQDPIFTIREAAIQNYKQITEIFGAQWASRYALPKIMALQSESNYLHRLTPLFGVIALAPSLSAEIIRKQVMGTIQALQQDRVANIRMNVAKSIASLTPGLVAQGAVAQDIVENFKQVLQALAKDADDDVAFYAGQALAKLTN